MVIKEKSKYAVRNAVVNDAGQIARVHVAAWRYAYAGLMPDSVLRSQSESRREVFWRGYISEKHNWPVFVLDCERIEGFASVIPARDKDVDSSLFSELAAIYLSEPASGKALGAQLLSYCMNEARAQNRQSMVLWVLDNNERAIRFYSKHGFIPDGESKYDRHIEANEIRMRATLL